ncbi:Succinate dehydrogenase assembly factor 2, mitochondrial [Savitreella phatthalungensis]
MLSRRVLVSTRRGLSIARTLRQPANDPPTNDRSLPGDNDPAGAFHKNDFVAQDPYPLIGRLDPPPPNARTSMNHGPVHFPDETLPHPPIDRSGETVGRKRARLLWQSRKRGILETDLLLSTFAAKYLGEMTPEELELYDKLLDEPDWEIYYYATGKKTAPAMFQDTPLLHNLMEHVKNEEKVSRRMPGLAPESANYRADRALDNIRFSDGHETNQEGKSKDDGRPLGEDRLKGGKNEDLGETVTKDKPAGYAS